MKNKNDHFNGCRISFWQNSTSIYDTHIHNKVGTEGKCLNIIKATYDKPTTNIPLRQECPLSPLLFNIMLGVFTTAIKWGKEIKLIHTEKEEIKLSLFIDDMILYIEYPKDTTKTLLEQIKGISKVARYKINIHKSVAFQWMKNES